MRKATLEECKDAWERYVNALKDEHDARRRLEMAHQTTESRDRVLHEMLKGSGITLDQVIKAYRSAGN